MKFRPTPRVARRGCILRSDLRMPWSKLAECFFWALGIILLGTYAYVYLDRTVYQAYEDWAFERALSRRPAPVIGFLWDSLLTGSPHRIERKAVEEEDPARKLRMISRPSPEPAPKPAPPHDPGLIGKLVIPRLGLEAIVRAGTDSRTLRRALGHVEGTAMPGEPGNVAIAGHRDMFFGNLRDVRKSDRIELRTLAGTHEYIVDSLMIVEPENVSVLKSRPDEQELTLVTCYPFNYIGNAPKRYIVKARAAP